MKECLEEEALACDFTKSNTVLWVFFKFFKLYKWYEIAQSVSNIKNIENKLQK